MKKFRKTIMFIVLLLCLPVVLTCSSYNGTTSPSNEPVCLASYCGKITRYQGTTVTWKHQDVGYGYSYDGYLYLEFDPKPPTGMEIEARLNLGSVDGRIIINEKDTRYILHFSGVSIHCEFETEPSSWLITDVDYPNPALAIMNFNWSTTSCGDDKSDSGTGINTETNNENDTEIETDTETN